MFLKFSLLCVFTLFIFNLQAQVGINTVTPQATLDIQGLNHNGAVSATDGILVPRVNSLGTDGQEDGQLVYLIEGNSNQQKGFYHWNGEAWTPISAASSPNSDSTLVVPDANINVGPTSVKTFTINPNTTIYDNQANNSIIEVRDVQGKISNISLSLSITHSAAGDLDIFLIAPTGEILELSTDNGNSNDNYINTIFSDFGATNITMGSAPFTGIFKPEGSFTPSGRPVFRTANVDSFDGFKGIEPNGDWILRIGDDAGNDIGALISATLLISGTTDVPWTLIGEVPIMYLDGTAIIVQASYSGDPLDENGVITALTRTNKSAGTKGTTSDNLPGKALNYSSDSAIALENFWVSTHNQARNVGLTNNKVFYYQLWRKGNIEFPVSSNETHSLIPIRIQR